MSVGSIATLAVTYIAIICGTMDQTAANHTVNLRVLYEWNDISFDYPSTDAESADISSGAYIPGRAFISDVDVYYPPHQITYAINGKPKIFVTTPRFLGVPATLSVVSNKKNLGMNLLQPYPSWEWNQNSGDCASDRLLFVLRIEIDPCGRLWLMDDGRIDASRVCPPKVIVFDLKTDKLIYRYDLPEGQYEKNSYFSTIIVDYRNVCDEMPFVYLADSRRFSLIVLDSQNRKSWLIEDKTFYPDAKFAKITVNGLSVETMWGIKGMALSPYYPNQERKLYYSPFNGLKEYWISTQYLRNSSNQVKACLPVLLHNIVSNILPNQRDSLSLSKAIDKNGNIYFGFLEKSALVSYSTNGNTGTYQELYRDNVLLEVIDGLKVIDNTNSGKQELWVVSNRLNKIATCTINRKEINYRIMVADINDNTGQNQFNTNSGGNSNSRSSGGYVNSGYGNNEHTDDLPVLSFNYPLSISTGFGNSQQPAHHKGVNGNQATGADDDSGFSNNYPLEQQNGLADNPGTGRYGSFGFGGKQLHNKML